MDRKYLILGILIIFAIILIGSQLIQQPEITLTDVSFSDLSLASITADLTFEIKNPYILGGYLETLALTVYGGSDSSRFLIADIEKSSVNLPAMSAVSISVPAKIRTTGIGRSGLSLLLDEKLPVQVTGSARINVLGIPITIPVNETRTISRDGVEFKVE